LRLVVYFIIFVVLEFFNQSDNMSFFHFLHEKLLVGFKKKTKCVNNQSVDLIEALFMNVLLHDRKFKNL
jgi:hypothetical protein